MTPELTISEWNELCTRAGVDLETAQRVINEYERIMSRRGKSALEREWERFLLEWGVKA